MFQAIEAISKSGVIEPIEPVQFDEHEHLIMLRLSKPWKPQEITESIKDWKQLVGILKSSPNLNGDPFFIQQEMRNEWD
jgi:predicted DNA-binding antitoxin AbrB/MazE fold protein